MHAAACKYNSGNAQGRVTLLDHMSPRQTRLMGRERKTGQTRAGRDRALALARDWS
jgi:hypothetical protein